MGDSWRFDPNKDYLNDELDGEDSGRRIQRFGKNKNRNNKNNQQDFEKSFKKGKKNNRSWR